MLDGFDNLLMGFSIPSLMADWHVERGVFVPIVSLNRLKDVWGPDASEFK